MFGALWGQLERLEYLVAQALGLARAAHIAVEGQAELTAMSSLPDGTMVWVKQLLSWWHYRSTRPVAEDGITIVYAPNGGCWIRDTLFFHAIQWKSRAVWHIDFANGDDWNSGLTQGAAIKTLAELMRRIGDDHTFDQDVDIYCYGDNDPHDPLRIDGWRCCVPRSDTFYIPPTPPGYALRQIRFHAMSPRTYYTGSFTALQAMDWTTNTPYVVTDTNMLGSNQVPPVPPPNDTAFWYNQQLDWFDRVRGTNHDQQRIRITSGPRAGAVAWTAAANLGVIFGGGGGGAIRTSNFGVAVPFAYTAQFATLGVTAVVPQVGDPYVVEELPLIHIDYLVMGGSNDYGGSGIAFNGFNFRAINGGDSQNTSNQPTLTVDGGSIAFVDCNFDFSVAISIVPNGSFAWFVNCSTIDGISALGGDAGFCYVDAGQHHLNLTATNGAIMIIDADAMITTGSIYAIRMGQVWPMSCQVWDLPGHNRKAGVMCYDHGTVTYFGAGSIYGTTRLWGIDQTGSGPPFVSGRAYAIAALDGGRFLYDSSVANIQNQMTIEGRSKFFGIGRSWENGETAVSIDPTTMLPTTLRDTTKANLFATIGAGGFGGRAVDPQTGGLIGPVTSPTQPTA